MVLSPTARRLLRAAAFGVLAFIYVPLALVLLNSFSASATFAWPPPGLTLRWWQVAASNEGVRAAVLTSVQVALIATAIAVVLGLLAAMALVRYEFFGREVVSLLVVLPIALWDSQQIGFPLLLHSQTLPQWVNASLWGIVGVVGFDVFYTMLALVARTPLGNMLPPWVRTLPLAVSVPE